MKTVWLLHSSAKSVQKRFLKSSQKTSSKTCAELVSAFIGNLRKMIKTELAEEIKEIDGIVKRIMKI